MTLRWPRVRLGDVAAHSLGKMLDKAKNKGELQPYLRNLNVRWFEFDLTDLLEMRFLRSEVARYTAQKGDVLVCEGGYPGRAAIWNNDEPIFFQKALHRVRFREPDHSKWFVYYLYSRHVDGTLKQHFGGTGIQHFTGEALDAFELPIPPLSELRRIVDILDNAFTGLAIAKANAQKNLINAHALFSAKRHAVFEQRGEGWVEKTINQLSTNLDSQRVPITKSKRRSGQYPYYGASGIVDYVDDYIFDGPTLLVSEDGANLLMRSAPIAFSASGKYWVNNHAHVLRFESMTTQRFVEFYLESIDLDEYVTGAAQPKLTQRALNLIPIPIPERVDGQAAVIETIESFATETERLESIYQRKLAAVIELERSLLHRAFTGAL